jgi:hypothetical protein
MHSPVLNVVRVSPTRGGNMRAVRRAASRGARQVAGRNEARTEEMDMNG